MGHPTTPVKVRISRAVQHEMGGTGIVQEPGVPWSNEPHRAAAARSLSAKLTGTSSTRKDGSITVALDLGEAQVLFSYMDVWNLGARENLRDEPECLSQIRSSQSVMDKLVADFGSEVTKW